MIEFVSYTGAFPCLCSGILTVRVDGKTWHFGYGRGYSVNAQERELVPRLPPFWTSGGWCGFDDDWNEDVGEGPWEMCVSPSQLEYYPPEVRERLPDILAVMNENVPFGCCGGCI